MNIFENLDDFERSLRDKLEGKSMQVPENTWPVVNASTLALHLAKYKNATHWLLGILGTTLACLVATSWLLYTKLDAPKANFALNKVKIDTVYITKVKEVFVPIYVKNNSSNLSNPNTKQELVNTTLRQNFNHYNDFEQLNAQTQASHKANPSSDSLIVLDSIATHLSYTSKNIVGLSSLDSKDFKFQKSSLAATFPQIKLQKSITSEVNPPEKSVKFPVKVSLDFYISNENNFVDILRNDKKAFDYANQGSRSSNTLGGRAEIRLSKKWSVLTGLEFSELRLEENDKSLSFIAENILGIPSFLYRTAVGTIKIPNNNLNTNPKIGSTLNAESNDPLSLDFVKTSLGLRYHVVEKDYRFDSRNSIKFGLYTQIAGVLSIPVKQDVALSLSQVNTASTFFSTNDIQNQNETFGLNFGIGLKSEIKNFGLFIEPSLSQTLTSMVKDMPIKTYLRSVGVKMGVSWRLK